MNCPACGGEVISTIHAGGEAYVCRNPQCEHSLGIPKTPSERLEHAAEAMRDAGKAMQNIQTNIQRAEGAIRAQAILGDDEMAPSIPLQKQIRAAADAMGVEASMERVIDNVSGRIIWRAVVDTGRGVIRREVSAAGPSWGDAFVEIGLLSPREAQGLDA